MFTGGLTSREFLSLLNDDTNYVNVLNHLDNLCERLLIMINHDKGKYVINPLLTSFYKENVLNASVLFNSIPMEDEPCKSPLNKNDLRAIINYFIFPGNTPEKIFPQFSSSELQVIEPIMNRFLLQQGSLYKSGDLFFINRKKIHELLLCNTFQICLWAICEGYSEYANRTICEILAFLKELGRTSKDNLKRIILLFMIKNQIDEPETDYLVSTLLSFHLITEKNGTIQISSKIVNSNFEPLPPRSNLMIDRNGEISYYGEPDPNDILFYVSKIKTCENMVTYSMTRETYTQARENGFSSHQIISFFKDTDLIDMIKMWEQDYNRVRVYEGITVKTDPALSQVIDTHPILKEHIICKIAPNVYFMKTSTEKTWRSILAASIGMTNIYASKKELPALPSDNFIETNYTPCIIINSEIGNKENLSKSYDELKAELISTAAKKKCINDKIINLIEKRLIISPDQIDKSFKYESTENTVSGFDFKAKFLLIKSVIKDKHALLKLETLNETIICDPIELSTGANQDSVVKVNVMPDGESRNISVSSIFSVTAISRAMV